MSQTTEVTCTCAACGKESRQSVLVSTITLGAADLDLRPAEMMRSTMDTWAQECPHCGYVADQLKDASPVSADFLASAPYVTCGGIAFKSALARRFFRQYLIACAAGKTDDAFNAIMHAAWACDDAEDAENAALCREKALEKLAVNIMNDGADRLETDQALRMDLLRRTGQFGKVISEYSYTTFTDGLLENLRRFQLACARKKDAACHTVAECEEKPAQRIKLPKLSKLRQELGDLPAGESGKE